MAWKWHLLGTTRARLLLLGPAILAATVAFGVRHDYKEYVVHWGAVLAGEDPWGGTNAYGPLHNLFAWLFGVWPLLPKVAFAALAVACAAFLRARAPWRRDAARSELALLTAFLLNPLVFFSVYVYGQNDIVAAFFVLLALVARGAGRPALAGLAIGVAALGKFYPLAFAGLLMLEGGRGLRVRVPVTALGSFLVGMGASYLVWGPTTLSPLLFASGRDAKMLSPYRLLACHPGLVGGQEVVSRLLDTNIYVVLAVGLVALAGLHAIGATWKAAAALGFLGVLAAYKVGHPQFYVTWLICLAWLMVTVESSQDRDLVRSLAPMAVFLALFQIVYAITGAMTADWAYLRCYSSIPFVAVTGFALIRGIGSIWTSPALRARVMW